MCVQHGSICHIAVPTCHIANCVYVPCCSVQHDHIDCNKSLHLCPATSSSTRCLPLYLSSKLNTPFVLKQISPALCQRLPPQLVAMHGCCQHANCIANASRCETYRTESSWGNTACISAGDAYLFALSGWYMLTKVSHSDLYKFSCGSCCEVQSCVVPTAAGT